MLDFVNNEILKQLANFETHLWLNVNFGNAQYIDKYSKFSKTLQTY